MLQLLHRRALLQLVVLAKAVAVLVSASEMASKLMNHLLMLT